MINFKFQIKDINKMELIFKRKQLFKNHNRRLKQLSIKINL